MEGKFSIKVFMYLFSSTPVKMMNDPPLRSEIEELSLATEAENSWRAEADVVKKPAPDSPVSSKKPSKKDNKGEG